MSNNKTINVILGLIGLAVIAFFIFNIKAAPTTGDTVATSTPTQSQNVVYSSSYGFTFTLPASWKGYSIVPSAWQGNAISGTSTVATGPFISIRNPLWTASKPYQDIPIMVFTLKQWDDMQRDKFHIGAAPINPSELGRNATYVFALPARYNFAFPAGWEEVESILKTNPLHTF